jgi:ubiquinone biosynthesis protein UbiJ
VNGLARRAGDVDAGVMSIGHDPAIRVSRDEIDAQVSRVEQRLVEDFSAQVPPALVKEYVHEAHSELATARITQFIPTLIERHARGRLLELTRSS